MAEERSSAEFAKHSELVELGDKCKQLQIPEAIRLVYEHIARNPRHDPRIFIVAQWYQDFFEAGEIVRSFKENPSLQGLQSRKTIDGEQVVETIRIQVDNINKQEVGLVIAEPRYPSQLLAYHEGGKAPGEWDAFYAKVTIGDVQAGEIDFDPEKFGTTPVYFKKRLIGDQSVERKWRIGYLDLDEKWSGAKPERVINGVIDAYNTSLGSKRPLEIKADDNQAKIIPFKAKVQIK